MINNSENKNINMSDSLTGGLSDDLLDLIKKQYKEHIDVVNSNGDFSNQVAHIAKLIIDAYKKGNRVYVCGNGGSTCDAMHMVEELVAQYKHRRAPLPAQHLMDSSVLTCWSNDESFSDVFRRQVEAYGKSGDVLIGISTSGNSENVLLAIQEAKKKDMVTIAFVGKDGGKIKAIADANLHIKTSTTARIQEMHILAIHSIIEAVDAELFGL